MQYAEKIADARKRVIDTLIALRAAEAEISRARAEAETRIIERAGGEKALGANEDARKRAMLVALYLEDDYQLKLNPIQELRATADRLQAELDSLLDARREAEWNVRERFAPILAGRDAPDEQQHPEDAAVDVAIEQAIDGAVGEIAELTPEEIAALPF